MFTLFFYLFIQIDLRTKLIEVLRIFQTRPISALPVVDSEKRLCDVYSKFDIIVKEIFSIFQSYLIFYFLLIQHLAATSTYANLDVPLCDILDTIHDHNTYQLATCKMTDQLFELMDKFVTREVNYI